MTLFAPLCVRCRLNLGHGRGVVFVMSPSAAPSRRLTPEMETHDLQISWDGPLLVVASWRLVASWWPASSCRIVCDWKLTLTPVMCKDTSLWVTQATESASRTGHTDKRGGVDNQMRVHRLPN